MATNIKITALNDITSANMTYNDIVAVVDMNGTPETKKANVQLVGNLILSGSGGSNFAKAAQAINAETVSNAAQPAITSVGTLTAVTVTGNVAAGNVSGTGGVFTYVSGDGANLTNVPAGAATSITDGTSNVDIPTTDGNVTVGVGGVANVLIATTTGVNVTGTLNATGIITGDAGGISNVVYANVTGTPTLGNISTLDIDGSASNVLYGNGVFAAASSPALTGDGYQLSNITGANVSGEVSFAATANAVAGANVSGEVTNAATANAVAGANVSGEVGFSAVSNSVAGANVSGEVTFAATANAVAYANVTGTPTLGNISPLNLDGNVANVLAGDGTFIAAGGGGGSYGDSNVVTLLNAFGSNTITTTGLITGDVNGALLVDVYNDTGVTLNKGDAVYLTGGNNGGNPEVALADADDPTKMPALGIVKENIGTASVGQVTTSGVINDSSHGYTLGADLYVSTTPGQLTTTVPTGEANGIQKIGKVVNSNQIIVQGAFRTNATPNLDEGNIFIGNATNQATSAVLNDKINTHLAAFGSNTITTTGVITGDGSGLSAIAGANVSGTVALATTSGTVSTAAQPNITSLGTLVDLDVTGNIAGANINANTNGFAIGYKEIPPVVLSADDTLALEDSGKHFRSTTAGNITLSIPTNATVAFPTGTAISIVEQAAGNILVNAISGVTLYQAGNSIAGNRVVSTYGVATLMKVDTDAWFISGTGVS